MDTTTEEPFRAEMLAIYNSSQAILNSNACLARSQYHEALELADAAADLAEAAQLGDETLKRCRELQAYCLSLLREKYRLSEDYERDQYERSAAAKRAYTFSFASTDASSSPHSGEELKGFGSTGSWGRSLSIKWVDQVA
ncbi:hypothetical protein PGQ11_002339 [Apiospora arundinis]|uniref:MIT domain-containing protein n=1 Tax=Apiospora arundinis TaxID=335852 RepID=A0ABR2JHW3_9PEZI